MTSKMTRSSFSRN